MIEVYRSLIIGAVQGVTEFLPISSSAHLVLVPYIFNWDYKGLSFDIALHFGTVIAIVAYFWKDWMVLIKSAASSRQPADSDPAKYPKNLLWQIIIATIPTAIIGYLISDYVESTFHSPILLASNLVIFGIILYLVDLFTKTSSQISNIGYKQTFTVGLAQCLALIPGVSRSGITMIASRSLGLDRENAARFSFLLGTPAMIGAFIFDIKDLPLSSINLPFILGVISSTFFGFLTIKYLLQYLKRGNFSVFMWYRILLAGIVLAIYFAR
ncbi:MAG: undecaprenyl-diphosphatase UppP [Patescibacteria group bacterium]